jgi:uncharacterized protein
LNLRSNCIGIGFTVLLMGCTQSPIAHSYQSPTKAVAPLTQELPITAEIEFRGKKIQLEVARTPEQQQIGLMNRKSLEDDRGMVFLFDPPRPTRFWMKNTLISLDMVFVRNGIVKSIEADVPPCKADPCPTYGSAVTEIDQVIELRGGRARELGLKAGDRFVVKFFNENSVQTK